ncbi:hypothetical protein COEREDRAFT_15799 [Coemansia reversa NRRL 1564]|uniref:Uncharacterized protein n=1 Tax=Coemansia reversa (strain ATCC 12441 / NRRL 1564) TaxID=763665 RepID=A0A2G5BAD6_COERN|nr:hypothetical protein COEREDRAFT_15799 [Coemansia reversa NRRL 1564]|eukprot:PIA15960.1 hypothetical protein COEREDRAFT_15799 [Coemansia reversa NRRL 1564]
MAPRGIFRSAHDSLNEIREGERRWDGWNSDATKVANELVNLLLQQHSAQLPAVWHPSLTFMFPDLPRRFEDVNLEESKVKLSQLRNVLDKMRQNVFNIKAAAEKLNKLLLQTDQDTANNTSEDPLFAFGSLRFYAELANGASKAYDCAMDTRYEHISELENTIKHFEGVSDVLPSGALDSDGQLVKLLIWQHSPGLKDSQLDVCGRNAIITLADFDELLALES